MCMRRNIQSSLSVPYSGVKFCFAVCLLQNPNSISNIIKASQSTYLHGALESTTTSMVNTGEILQVTPDMLLQFCLVWQGGL